MINQDKHPSRYCQMYRKDSPSKKNSREQKRLCRI